MDSKIFLGKYRVAADEMEAVGDIADNPLAYEAEEIDSRKKVVVEVIPAASLKAAVRERLEAEAIAAKKLSHANIPALNDFGVENDQLVYVTEDFEGTLAEEWVNSHGPMPVGPVLRIASQVVSALGAAAFHRINHHAINPSNLVLVPGQTAEGDWPLVKVLHFVGVAPKLSGNNVAVASFDKSLHYASPEQIQNGTVDFRSELYSLGATMWFLLTGAPPPVVATGPTGVIPAKTAVVAEKIDAVPKKVRRLLSQMLAVNPDARPGDPLAFYRQLQDCLHQVERRETMSRALGIPAFSPALPRRRRSAVKTLALAAVFLAAAAVTALVLSGYLRHGRIVRAEEPIGKPIGVPEATASATPVTATTNAIASDTTPPTTTVVDSTSVQSAPPANAESSAADLPPVSTDRVVMASTVQAAVTPPRPAVVEPPKDQQSQAPAPVAANDASALPPATDSREVASSKPPAPTPGEPPSTVEAGPVAQQTESEKITMREVRRAEPPGDEPEVRRAEPPPPEEGRESVVAEATPPDSEPKVPTTSLAKRTEVPARPRRQAETKTEPGPPEEGPESVVAEATAPESEPAGPAKSPAQKPEPAAKPKRQAEKKKSYSRQSTSESDEARPRSRERTGRARLVGVTPEGWWMLKLPSNRIIVVPPPPSSR
jgi:serine/threonine protein kinase